VSTYLPYPPPWYLASRTRTRAASDCRLIIKVLVTRHAPTSTNGTDEGSSDYRRPSVSFFYSSTLSISTVSYGASIIGQRQVGIALVVPLKDALMIGGKKRPSTFALVFTPLAKWLCAWALPSSSKARPTFSETKGEFFGRKACASGLR